MGTKHLKWFCAFWAGWIYFSSCFVITRFQFARAVNNITHVDNDLTTRFWQIAWWLADRTYHFFEFAILAALLVNAFEYFRKRPFFAVPILVLYAASDEFHQSLVNIRAAHLYDVCVDTLGVFLAIWLFVRAQIKRDVLAQQA